MLAAFSVAMIFQVRRTQQQAEAARQVAGFLEDLFQVVDPSEARGNSVTAREILDRGARRIEDELADQPEIQARMMEVIGGVYLHLGLYGKAHSLLEGALERRRDLHGEKHPLVADGLHRLAQSLGLLARYEEAEAAYRQALDLRRRHHGERHESVAETLCQLGDVLTQTGRVAAAEPLYADCLDIRRQRFAEPHEAIAEALTNLAWAKDHQRQDSAAAALYARALEMYRQVHGEEHPQVALVLNNFGYLKMRAGQAEPAAELFQQALAIERKLIPEGVGWLIVQSNLAMARNLQDSFLEAERLAREASELLHQRLGPDDCTAYAEGVLGSSLTGLRRFEEAEHRLIGSYTFMHENMNATSYPAQAAERLIALYEAWGRDEQAARYRAVRDAAG